MARGSCACGEYTYEVASDPDAVIVCHCHPCRKFAGVNGSTNSVIEKSKYKVLSGTTQPWTRKGDSGKDVTNQYCSRCHTLMRVEADAMPEMLIYKPGTLDDQAVVDKAKPVTEIYTRNRPDCFAALEVPQNEGAPPA